MDTAAPLLPLLIDRLSRSGTCADRYGIGIGLKVSARGRRACLTPATVILDFHRAMTGQREPAMPGASVLADELEALFAVRWIFLTESMIHNPYFRKRRGLRHGRLLLDNSEHAKWRR